MWTLRILKQDQKDHSRHKIFTWKSKLGENHRRQQRHKDLLWYGWIQYHLKSESKKINTKEG